MARSIVLLGVVIAMSVAVAVYHVAALYHSYEPSADFYRVWGYVFALLLATWVDEDSRGRIEVDRPSFDIGMFMGLFWILYLPWYLVRTRGAKGWLWIAGLLALPFLGWILHLLLYVAT
ncbi:MAG TPA: hypothetical protein VH814_26010 [Steroidobacteraceae bacterium]